MNYLDKSKEEIEDLVAKYGLDDDMFFDLFDEALELQKRIEELENYIRMTEGVIG